MLRRVASLRGTAASSVVEVPRQLLSRGWGEVAAVGEGRFADRRLAVAGWSRGLCGGPLQPEKQQSREDAHGDAGVLEPPHVNPGTCPADASEIFTWGCSVHSA
jgi:hypothetical protein